MMIFEVIANEGAYNRTQMNTETPTLEDGIGTSSSRF